MKVLSLPRTLDLGSSYLPGHDDKAYLEPMSVAMPADTRLSCLTLCACLVILGWGKSFGGEPLLPIPGDLRPFYGRWEPAFKESPKYWIQDGWLTSNSEGCYYKWAYRHIWSGPVWDGTFNAIDLAVNKPELFARESGTPACDLPASDTNFLVELMWMDSARDPLEKDRFLSIVWVSCSSNHALEQHKSQPKVENRDCTEVRMDRDTQAPAIYDGSRDEE